MVAYIFLHFLNYLVGVLVIDFGRKKNHSFKDYCIDADFY